MRFLTAVLVGALCAALVFMAGFTFWYFTGPMSWFGPVLLLMVLAGTLVLARAFKIRSRAAGKPMPSAPAERSPAEREVDRWEEAGSK